MPLVREPARPARRRRRARQPEHELRGGREVSARSTADLEAGARLAPAPPALLGGQLLQPGLPGRDRRGRPAPDAERVPSRRRDDPPLLGLGALLCPLGPRPGPAARRAPRAALEPLRSDP